MATETDNYTGSIPTCNFVLNSQLLKVMSLIKTKLHETKDFENALEDIRHFTKYIHTDFKNVPSIQGNTVDVFLYFHNLSDTLKGEFKGLAKEEMNLSHNVNDYNDYYEMMFPSNLTVLYCLFNVVDTMLSTKPQTVLSDSVSSDDDSLTNNANFSSEESGDDASQNSLGGGRKRNRRTTRKMAKKRGKRYHGGERFMDDHYADKSITRRFMRGIKQFYNDAKYGIYRNSIIPMCIRVSRYLLEEDKYNLGDLLGMLIEICKWIQKNASSVKESEKKQMNFLFKDKNNIFGDTGLEAERNSIKDYSFYQQPQRRGWFSWPWTNQSIPPKASSDLNDGNSGTLGTDVPDASAVSNDGNSNRSNKVVSGPYPEKLKLNTRFPASRYNRTSFVKRATAAAKAKAEAAAAKVEEEAAAAAAAAPPSSVGGRRRRSRCRKRSYYRRSRRRMY